MSKITLSYKRGKRIAKRTDTNQTIYLYDPEFACCPTCLEKGKCTPKKRCCANCSKENYHVDSSDSQFSSIRVRDIIQALKKGDMATVEDLIDEPEPVEGGSGAVMKKIHISNADGKFQIMPSNQPNVCRDCVLIVGRQGSGKSWYVAQYITNFSKCYPAFRVYLFSHKDKDPLLDDKISKRIDIKKMAEAQFTAIDFKNSLVIFDDVDSISDEKVKKTVYDLVRDCADVGRSYGVFMIVTNHLAANHGETKTMLNSCTQFVFFPVSSSHGTEYVLKDYFGLSPKKAKKLIELPDTKWVTITRDLPSIVITEKDLMFISEL